PILLLLLAIVGAVPAIKQRIAHTTVGDTTALGIVCGLTLALQLAFAIAVGGDWMPGARFLIPLMPPLCLLAALAMRRWPLFIRTVLIGFFLSAGLLQAKR